jgi:hypothetical protein
MGVTMNSDDQFEMMRWDHTIKQNLAHKYSSTEKENKINMEK